MILAVLDMEEREEKRKLISAVSTQSGYIVGQKIITVSSERRNGILSLCMDHHRKESKSMSARPCIAFDHTDKQCDLFYEVWSVRATHDSRVYGQLKK